MPSYSLDDIADGKYVEVGAARKRCPTCAQLVARNWLERFCHRWYCPGRKPNIITAREQRDHE